MKFKEEIYLLAILLLVIIIASFCAAKFIPNADLLKWLLGLGSMIAGGLLLLIQNERKTGVEPPTQVPGGSNNGSIGTSIGGSVGPSPFAPIKSEPNASAFIRGGKGTIGRGDTTFDLKDAPPAGDK